MAITAFGRMTYKKMGWKTTRKITLFSTVYEIVINCLAYEKDEPITEEQQAACADFAAHEGEILKKIERMIEEFGDRARFTPTVLFIEQDGAYAMLFDDSADEDDGIAVCISPKEEILTQDQYL